MQLLCERERNAEPASFRRVNVFAMLMNGCRIQLTCKNLREAFLCCYPLQANVFHVQSRCFFRISESNIQYASILQKPVRKFAQNHVDKRSIECLTRSVQLPQPCKRARCVRAEDCVSAIVTSRDRKIRIFTNHQKASQR